MAGAGLIAIKRRIKSVKNTQKITKAMGLVSTSKLRKCREALNNNNIHFNNLKDLVETVSEYKYHDFSLSHDALEKKKLIIIFTSDAGLCGGFNSNVVSKVVSNIRGTSEKTHIVTIGAKGKKYLNKYKIAINKEFIDIPNIPNLNDTKDIVEYCKLLLKQENVDEIYAVYTKFQSSVTQEVVYEKILPIDNNTKEDTNNAYDYVLYEPDLEEIHEKIIYSFLENKILNMMLNSKTSEQASRMTAMDGASRNANEILEKLNLKYNRIRQSIITQEISEIVGGAEAQK